MAHNEDKAARFGYFTASSSSWGETTGLVKLAVQADSLSDDLNEQRQHCGHDSTSTEISNAADELKLLANELQSLDAAVKANKDLYTEAFGEDLAEVQNHLGGIFEDIADCCQEMQKANGLNTSAVGWLAKKRYVKKLQKHLEANKTTLIVMRTVLHHGKEYGMHNSPGRLAESSPHTIQEDLAILETVFASRHAIKDLHNLANKSHEHSSSTSSAGSIDITPSFKPGAHGRNLSSATGVDVSVIEDVLPTSDKKKKQDALAQRFSRRGVRLAVHSSIMDTNAHEVPISLRKKWIYQAQLRRTPEHFNAGSPSIAQLSKISEVNSSSGLDEAPPAVSRQRALATPGNQTTNESPERSDSQASSVSGRRSKARERSASLVSSPLGKKLGNLITRLSHTNLRERRVNGKGSPPSIEQHIYPPSEANTQGDLRKKEQRSPEKEMTAKEKPGWSYRLTRPFVKEELTTPDFEKGF
ncbi:hypothetical protein A1O7_05501 [Cladophialophora yegresii CBS 114405]|uniref:Uncharacterized protein n=1 Tax=Cladophialophora yegresii CBS 114405 TaxID=1182544 RepID=W9VQR9_9EURO|nr:uncharacterized protein A1O7_05501 [Cladophialophora yegresii CBS 114405]EXJ58077.1 hypothetical protein A1O7_05501 [Cladophialophora yegresii CBS 114405]